MTTTTSPALPLACTWQIDEDGVYDTGCHERFFFDSGDITENKFAFCPYCGKKILKTKSEGEN